jgi:type VI secretion system VasD/TssJ family lipoprotein
MDEARRAFIWLWTAGLAGCTTTLAGCTTTRQTLSDATGWVSKKLDPAPPPPPAAKIEPAPPPKPVMVVPSRQLQLAIQAGTLLNPDVLNRPSPVVVRVYLLKAEITFGAADFFSLFERDAATLGADLLAREELQLRPGRLVSVTRDLPPEARFLGVVVAFRDVEKSTWRSLANLPDPPAATAMPPDLPIKVPVRIAVDGGSIAVSIG